MMCLPKQSVVIDFCLSDEPLEIVQVLNHFQFEALDNLPQISGLVLFFIALHLNRPILTEFIGFCTQSD